MSIQSRLQAVEKTLAYQDDSILTVINFHLICAGHRTPSQRQLADLRALAKMADSSVSALDVTQRRQ